MKIFISWSGERSRHIAEGLRDWIPHLINDASPWLSSADIEPGARWGPHITANLEQTDFGILCLTPENLAEPWILFEAGALSKSVDRSKVTPYLYDLTPADVKYPLAQFQAIQASRGDTKKLINSINSAVQAKGGVARSAESLTEAFDVWWPRLETILQGAPKVGSRPRVEKPQREILEEILSEVRVLRRLIPGTRPPRRATSEASDLARLERIYIALQVRLESALRLQSEIDDPAQLKELGTRIALLKDELHRLTEAIDLSRRNPSRAELVNIARIGTEGGGGEGAETVDWDAWILPKDS
jgi:hypothetical protein